MAKKPGKPESETSTPAVISLSPKLKAFTIHRQGQGNWKVISYDIQDDKVLNKTESDGGDKALCLERLKIMIAKEFFLGR